MASYVRKKIPNNTVLSFCMGWAQLNTGWAEGPYMRSTKCGPVTVTYWEQKRTLMFQGPIIPTANLNEQFKNHKQRIQETETLQTGETQKNNNAAIHIIDMPTRERQGKTQMICDIEETTQITVTMNQVTHTSIHHQLGKTEPRKS